MISRIILNFESMFPKVILSVFLNVRKAIKDKKISGKAGPVINTTGINMSITEKKITSDGIDRSVNSFLKGLIALISMI